MLPKIVFCCLFLFFVSKSHAQNEPPTVTLCGDQHICLTDSIYNLCVTIDIDPSFSLTIHSFIIEWGDGTHIMIPGSNMPGNQSHQYELPHFYNSCAFDTDFNIDLYTYVEELPDPLYNGSKVFFRKEPIAKFALERDTICVGDMAVMTNTSCPTEQILNVSWNYGEDDILYPDNFHDYNAVGSYEITLWVENPCGIDSTTRTIEVITLPTANIEPLAGIQFINNANVVCLGGGGTILLDGSTSVNSTSYMWGPFDSAYSWPNGRNNETAQINFNTSGNYDIILTVLNECKIPVYDTINIEVIDDVILELNTHPDTCIEIQYTPTPLVSNAIYIVNGDTINQINFPILLNEQETHTVAVFLENTCGLQMRHDTFAINEVEEVVITMPNQDTTTICFQSEPLVLESETLGGNWQGDFISQNNNIATFTPLEIGTFSIIYSKGYGPCKKSDTLTITVEGTFPQVEDLYVCEANEAIPLTGTPAGGNWFSVECPTCIEDNLFNPIHLDGQSDVEIFYTTTSALGCAQTDTAIVFVVSPNASYSINSTPCANATLDLDYSDAIGENFIWRVDGEDTPFPFNNLSAGVHTIELIAIINECRDTFTNEVLVILPPQSANFLVDDTEICSGTGVTFNFDASWNPLDETNGNLQYVWNFNRNAEDTLINNPSPNPIIFENDTDDIISYSVTLTISNECAMLIRDTTIIVKPTPTPQIGIDSIDNGCTPFSVILTNRSLGNPDYCIWLLGDGDTLESCQDTFSHTFYANDTTVNYLVNLTVTSECGTATEQDTITVIPAGVQSFYHTNDFKVCPFDTVFFEDASTPIPTSWKWNFGDGTFSNLPNPSHVFELPNDTFTVSLQVSTGCGFDVIEHVMTTFQAPEVNFDLPSFGCEGQEIQGIINNSSLDNYAFYWDLGNGVKDSVHFNPTPIYSQGDETYTIKLTTIDGFPNFCHNSLEKEFHVRNLPKPNFILSDSTGCIGEPFTGTLSNTSQGANQWTWKFDDTFVSSSEHANYSFANFGEHSISLIASYDGVCTDSITKSVNVEDCNIYIPNAFSPNEDGRNDSFTIYAKSGVVKNIKRLAIYNRWGETLYERFDFPPSFNNNIDLNAWDGILDGKYLQPGVYVYMAQVEFINNKVKTYKGDITLLR